MPETQTELLIEARKAMHLMKRFVIGPTACVKYGGEKGQMLGYWRFVRLTKGECHEDHAPDALAIVENLATLAGWDGVYPEDMEA